MKYIVYQRVDEGTEIIAEVEGDMVTGFKAATVEGLLLENGWPETKPDIILHGLYMWAAEVV